MNKAVYIATSRSRSGKTLVALGLMNILLGKTQKVAYFRPIINDLENQQKDEHIQTMRSYFKIPMEYEDMFVFTRNQIARLLNRGMMDQILEKIIERYKAIEEKFDFVLVDGSDFIIEGSIVEFDLNVEIARNLGIPAVIVEGQNKQSVEELVSQLTLAYKAFREKDVEVLAVIANKVTDNPKMVRDEISFSIEDKDVLSAACAANPKLDSPSMQEINNVLGARVLLGKDYMNNLVEHFQVGAMNTPNFLKQIQSGGLIIAP